MWERRCEKKSEYRFYSCYGVFKVSRRRVGFKGSAISRKADKQRKAICLSIDRAIDTLNDTTVGFYLRDGDMDYKKILLCDLIMIETDRRRTKVYTDAEVFRTKKTLSEWQRELTEPFFMMPHNSFIINMNKIVKFSRTEIELEGGKKHYTVSVAPKRQAETKRILMSYFESRR